MYEANDNRVKVCVMCMSVKDIHNDEEHWHGVRAFLIIVLHMKLDTRMTCTCTPTENLKYV